MSRKTRSFAAILLAIWLTMSPLFQTEARAAYTLSATESEVLSFLTGELGLDRPAACGILGNIRWESGFDPQASCIDTNGKTSYGLCQWNGGRFERLKTFSADRGLDYTTVRAQLLYIQFELAGDESAALKKMQGLPDTMEGAYTAGYHWARYYERCYSGYYALRARTAAGDYWLGLYGAAGQRALFFDANGGSTPTAAKTVWAGGAYGTLPTPTRSDGTFLGWFTQQEGGERVNESTAVSFAAGRTLYAHWNSAESFVRRLYRVVLGREADSEGLRMWSGLLTGEKQSAAQVAAGFFSSGEYKGRGQTNEQFVTTLYATLLDRSPDGGGLATWLGHLQSGRSRCWVFSQFVRSGEFTALCASYGLRRGSVGENAYDMGGAPAAPAAPGNSAPAAPAVDEQQVRAFVTRLYELCLGRAPDGPGLENWTAHLVRDGWSGGRVAEGFVFSGEYTGGGHSEGEYVTMLYRVLLNREPDAEGYATWTGYLAQGQSRRWVFERIATSGEFASLCRSYGIAAGV